MSGDLYIPGDQALPFQLHIAAPQTGAAVVNGVIIMFS